MNRIPIIKNICSFHIDNDFCLQKKKNSRALRDALAGKNNFTHTKQTELVNLPKKRSCAFKL